MSTKLKEFERGDVIIQEGTHGDRFYILESGQVRVTEEVQPSKHTTETIRPGGIEFDDFGFRKEKGRVSKEW